MRNSENQLQIECRKVGGMSWRKFVNKYFEPEAGLMKEFMVSIEAGLIKGL